MKTACVYFGMEVPDRDWSMRLHGIDVVLQPYHPLVKYGGFAERFPSARRWIYVNPTTVDPWLLERAPVAPPIAGRDARWNLPRLDLDHPDGFAWAVTQAAQAIAADDGESHGLFVDDLDRLLPTRGDLALDYLAHVAIAAGRDVRWFLNRGFALWPAVEGLDAVLLEDISPSVTRFAPAQEIRWLRDEVLPAVDALRRRGISVHALSYADQESAQTSAPDLRFERDLASRVDSVITGVDRAADSWRVSA